MVSAPDLETLALLVDRTPKSTLAFAHYNSVAEREMAVRTLVDRLDTPLLEFTLTQENADPVELLGTVPPKPRVCVFFYDVEAALPRAARFLNLQREKLQQSTHAVVFWITDYGMKQLASEAPDLWAWRSGVFEFGGQMERTQEPVATSLVHGFAAESLGLSHDEPELARRVSLYQKLYNENFEGGDADPEFLGRLLFRQAEAEAALGRRRGDREAVERAKEIYLKALRSFASDSAASWRANVFQVLGEMDAETANHADAISNLDYAVAALDAALGRSSSNPDLFKKKANALVRRGESEAAQARHEQALQSYGAAVETYDAALALAPNDVNAHNNKGLTLADRGALYSERGDTKQAYADYAAAIAEFEASLKIAPPQTWVRARRDSIAKLLEGLRAGDSG